MVAARLSLVRSPAPELDCPPPEEFELDESERGKDVLCATRPPDATRATLPPELARDTVLPEPTRDPGAAAGAGTAAGAGGGLGALGSASKVSM